MSEVNTRIHQVNFNIGERNKAALPPFISHNSNVSEPGLQVLQEIQSLVNSLLALRAESRALDSYRENRRPFRDMIVTACVLTVAIYTANLLGLYP